MTQVISACVFKVLLSRIPKIKPYPRYSKAKTNETEKEIRINFSSRFTCAVLLKCMYTFEIIYV